MINRRSHAPANATTHGQRPLTGSNHSRHIPLPGLMTINTQRICGKRKKNEGHKHWDAVQLGQTNDDAIGRVCFRRGAP